MNPRGFFVCLSKKRKESDLIMSMKKIIKSIEYASTYGDADTTNYHDFPAWKIPLENVSNK